MAIKGTLVATGILLIFALVGEVLLAYLGISLAAWFLALLVWLQALRIYTGQDEIGMTPDFLDQATKVLLLLAFPGLLWIAWGVLS